MNNPQKNDVEDEISTEDVCGKCGGTGIIEILGDGENFECDVIGTKRCPECYDDNDNNFDL